LVPFDLAAPLEVFRTTRLANGEPAYRVRVCGTAKQIDAGAFRMSLQYGLSELTRADTVILPGITSLSFAVPPELVRAVRAAAARGARVASICSGAFLLAATGLLDGRRATTHWLGASDLARLYPSIEVDADVLFVDEGQVLTSAGAAAAFDLCLHMVRRDHGAAVAAAAARISVVPLERDGGQSQFIVHAPPAADDASLARILRWLSQNLHKPLTLGDIARRAATSVRSLNRHFKDQTGTTPLQWLLKARVRRAQVLLETTAHSIERIAADVGFGSVTSLREHFRRVALTSPQAYRRSFRVKALAARKPVARR
jgi:transcriptional regulator GlxA family with amidase domain